MVVVLPFSVSLSLFGNGGSGHIASPSEWRTCHLACALPNLHVVLPRLFGAVKKLSLPSTANGIQNGDYFRMNQPCISFYPMSRP